MTQEKITEILKSHAEWLQNCEHGERADLRYADLSGANLRHADLRDANLRHAELSHASLRYANLRGADLSYADLCDATLSGVKGVIVASCYWTYHGEQGRQVNAMLINDTIMFFCGCFMGDELKLREYIENGDPLLQGSRLKALDFLLTCFEPTK